MRFLRLPREVYLSALRVTRASTTEGRRSLSIPSRDAGRRRISGMTPDELRVVKQAGDRLLLLADEVEKLRQALHTATPKAIDAVAKVQRAFQVRLTTNGQHPPDSDTFHVGRRRL
jgi:hypothetical protein